MVAFVDLFVLSPGKDPRSKSLSRSLDVAFHLELTFVHLPRPILLPNLISLRL